MPFAFPKHPARAAARRLAAVALALGVTIAALTPAPAASAPVAGDATGMIQRTAYSVPQVSGGWFDRARAYADLMGGKGYQLVAKDVGTATNPTSSDTHGTIYVSSKFDALPHTTKLWLMAMRVALQKQYEIAPSLDSSAAFRAAGSDRSKLAWCMAKAKNTGFQTTLSCTSAQQTLAAAVWVGKVPGLTTVKHIVARYTQDGSPLYKPSAATSSEWMRQVRAYVDAAGGAGLPIRSATTSDCNGSKGCMRVIDGVSTIFIRGDIWKTMSHRAKVWLTMHEVAHHYQSKVVTQLNRSAAYASLFPKDMTLSLAAGHDGSNVNFPLEHLANCMTMAKGVVESAPMCTPAQISFAAGIWKGAVAR